MVPRIQDHRERYMGRRSQHRIWTLHRLRRVALTVAVSCCVALTTRQAEVSAFSLEHSIGNTVGGKRRISYDTENSPRIRSICLSMAASVPNASNDNDASGADHDSNSKNKKKVFKIQDNNGTSGPSRTEMELLQRMTKLEAMVAKQEIEIQQLKQQCMQLAEAASAFGRVVNLLREAGLETPESPILEEESEQDERQEKIQESTRELSKPPKLKDVETATVEYFDDSDIFGRAPASVIDAADAAGAAILAGMLGGKQRMLVDVRDAELSRDPETLVQFIELAILPVAAGLEGLKSTRNRVKIIFPTVSQLLEYRRTMALAAPEVVALSTLGFDPVEKMDNLVVIVAPSPDDEEGLLAMNELLEPTDPTIKPIDQPLVVLNYHMVPVQGLAARFEVAYHLRLLSVQFMTGNSAPENFKKWEEEKIQRTGKDGIDAPMASDVLYGPDGQVLPLRSNSTESEADDAPEEEEDAALEAAMKHAHELGMNQGVTRAMVIRAYPRPWHVFVDTSPDTDADFEVAATFDEEPTQDNVNYAIVECLEGSEIEDELVAQQMQEALESGQLDRVSEMLGQIPGLEDFAEESDDKASEGNGDEGEDKKASDDNSESDESEEADPSSNDDKK